VTALHEYECDCRKAGNAVADLDLSEEFLYHYCKRLDGLGKSTSGTTVEAAATALRDFGQTLERLCPYRTASTSAGPLVISPQATADAKTRTLVTLGPLPLSLKSIEDSLQSHRPVVAVLDWFSNSYLAPLGHVDIPGPSDRPLGRHAVLVVEIEDESRAGGCVLGFKNSWGPKWGKNGFGSFVSEYFRQYGRAIWSLTN
jgi:hypothetical protein